MHTLSALDFANETGVSLSELHDKAAQGETVANVDLAEYGVFEHHGDKRILTKVKVPSRLLANLGPGGVSETSDIDAYRAGKEDTDQDERGNPGGVSKPVIVRDSSGEPLTLDIDAGASDLPDKPAEATEEEDTSPDEEDISDTQEDTSEDTSPAEVDTSETVQERQNGREAPPIEQSLLALAASAFTLNEDQREDFCRDPYGLS